MSGSIRRALLVGLVLLQALTVSTLPAAAHGGGPAFYCDAGTLNNCTDTGDVASAEDFFSCEGEAREVVSCTNQTTGERAPYCAFHEYEPAKDQDHYLCGAEPTQEGGAGNHHG
jgi:hypothetical protein